MRRLAVERYAPSDWPRLNALLCAWPLKPLAGHAPWSIAGLDALCLKRAAGSITDPLTSAWVAKTADRCEGFASLRQLPWDTKLTGLSSARFDYLVAHGSYALQCEVKRDLMAVALHHCEDCDIQHLSIRLPASDTSGLHVLEEAGWITVDAILTFALELDDLLVAEAGAGIITRLATPADSQQAGDLARESYIHDRFHSDPAISAARANELHSVWLRNSCEGHAADAVILAEDEEGLLGYVTCKLQRDTQVHLGTLIGTIVLVATAERARKQGVARAATLAALDWFREQGTGIVEVGTQLRNIPASRLYESCGFRLVGSSISLRKVL